MMRSFLSQVYQPFARDTALSPLHPVLRDFLIASLVCAVFVAAMGLRLSSETGALVATLLFTVGAGVAGVVMLRTYPHRSLGLCNVITVFRLALTAVLASLLFSGAAVPEPVLWAAFAMAAFALILDGVDGAAARHARLTSGFGARFDMEVDTLAALVLALLAWKTGQAGLWVLALGLPRYLFVMAGSIWPRLTGDLPERMSRKVVCVIQVGTLVALLIPVLPLWLKTGATGIAAVALAWSFMQDIRHLLSRPE